MMKQIYDFYKVGTLQKHESAFLFCWKFITEILQINDIIVTIIDEHSNEC